MNDNMDIVYVTYNSSRWIKNCFKSIENSNYDISQLSIWVVDNASTDDTVNQLNLAKRQLTDKVANFEIIQSDENIGFGRANNLGFAKGKNEIVCFLNIDTELEKEALNKLAEDIEESKQNDKEVAVWEMRQFPYEHPKMYNPITMETSWCSGAAFAVKREVFDLARGFDDELFMYAEDVDLSWRIRSFGYKIRYVPKAIIYHYSYENAGAIKPTQYVNGIVNNILLRYRYGNIGIIIVGYLGVIKDIIRPEVYPGARKQLLEAFMGHFKSVDSFLKSRKLGYKGKSVATFKRFNYSDNRAGAFYYNEKLTYFPNVTILIESYGNNELLKLTLESLKNQTYDRINTIVCNHGDNYIKPSDVEYIFTIQEGDILFADYVEVMIAKMSNASKNGVYENGGVEEEKTLFFRKQ